MLFLPFYADSSVQLQFSNLDKEVSLVSRSNSYSTHNFEENYYSYHKQINQQQHKPLLLKLSHRLIVKLSADAAVENSLSKFKFVLQKELLYQAINFQYWSLQVAPSVKLDEALIQIKQHTDVLLVQPDILQVMTSSSNNHDATSNFTVERESMLLKTINQANNSGSGDSKARKDAVRIAIIDDGFDLSLPEFGDASIIATFDVVTASSNINPLNHNDLHGSGVLHVLLQEYSDNLNQYKESYGLDLITIRQPDTWTSNTLKAFARAQYHQADIINCSWHSQWLLEPVYDVITDLTRNGRNGKGTVVVFAAGNSGREIKQNTIEPGIDEALVIAAKTRKGLLAKFSNIGDFVDAAFSGLPALSHSKSERQPVRGTSAAAARASAYVARLMAKQPLLSAQEIEQEVKLAFPVAK